MEKQATTEAEIGCHIGGVATVSQQVVPPNEEPKIKTLKEFTYFELRIATMAVKRSKPDSVQGLEEWQNFNAKISDFGLSKLGPGYEETHVSTRIAGTVGYMAPEYIATGRIYVKSDVYAFGMVMLEIITGLRGHGRGQNMSDWARPFLSGKKRLQKIMDPRLEGDYPTKAASKIAELILICLRIDPKQRPSMEEVVSELQGINEIKVKPRRSKAKTRQSSDWHQQNHRWPPFGTKQDTEAWSARSWLSGKLKWISIDWIGIVIHNSRSMYYSTILILIVTVLDILVYYLQKQHKESNDEHKHSPLSSPFYQQSAHKDSSPSSLPDKRCRRFSLAEIKLATNDFDDAFVIGKGGFGKVYKGTIDFGQSIEVAIKRLNLQSNQGVAEFQAEIKMLSKFRHSHIVSLLGYCEEEMILVYEYMPNGSLEDHLHKKRANGSKSSTLTWVQRVNICIGAARGLDYLHTGTGVQCRVIHRDVKSSNILLDNNLAAKISDFGLSRTSPAYQLGTTNVFTDQIKGTFGYMDAEYFSTRRVTRKSDVYAFGVVLLEVLCGRPALDFTLDEQQHSLALWAKQCIKEGKVDRIIDPCLRVQVEGKCLKEFGQIAYECVLNSSKDRPTMTKVLARLEFVLAWTLQSVQSAGKQTRIRRSMIIEKAWSLFLTKSSKRMSPDKKKLGQSIVNKKKGFMMTDGGDHSRGVAVACQQVVPPRRQTKIPILKMFTLSELQAATKNFRQEMCLGEGGYGKVFKGWLDSVTFVPRKAGEGIAVAIKKSGPNRAQGLNEWQAEVKFLGIFNHPNVIKLFGYCWENKNFLLVYEYMQKGSLDVLLFREGAEPLPWDTRIKIATGAAQGLAFLHTAENNVIYFNAKLSDFGLARLGPVNGESHVSTDIAGTYGYMAPEYVATGRLFLKSDVYSFGVVMLEIITGLRASVYSQNGVKQNLVEWARPFLTNIKRLQIIMDPRLNQDYPSKGASKTAELILSCLESDPKKRPSMEDVVLSLQDINAIKMKPTQLKSKVNNPRHSMSVGSGDHIAAHKLKIFTFDELRGATRNFRPSATLGVSDGESVYKGWVDGSSYTPSICGVGIAVAIKISSTDNAQSLREWQNGQRQNALPCRPLPWVRAMKIAIGTAKGLVFLHNAENAPVYRTFNASNILLNEDYEPQLYFGSASLCRAHRALPVVMSDAVTNRCTPPEYVATGNWYIKSDIYAFGVMMLDMIAGSQFLQDYPCSSPESLMEWARPILTDNAKLQRIRDSWLEQGDPPKGACRAAELILSLEVIM
ncbi:receptor like protein kinase S.2-like protein [Tanacetum coccineum]